MSHPMTQAELPLRRCQDCRLDLGDVLRAVGTCPRWGMNRNGVESRCPAFVAKALVTSRPWVSTDHVSAEAKTLLYWAGNSRGGCADEEKDRAYCAHNAYAWAERIIGHGC